MKKPKYLTDEISSRILSDNVPLFKPYARGLGLTYKKLIKCYKFLGLSTEPKIKKEKREAVEYCKKRMLEDPKITIRQLSIELGRHEVGLAKLFREKGLREYNKRLTDDEEVEVRKAMLEGFGKKTAPKIAKELGLSKKQIRERYQKLGMKRNSLDSHELSEKVNAKFFEDWDKSENVAYILGLLWADGCIHYRIRKEKVSQKTLSISLIDEGMIYKISELIGNKYVVHKHEYKDEVIISGIKVKDAKPAYMISISNNYIVKTLEDLGMTERKSESACIHPYKMEHSEELRRSFIRGYFDGDGSSSFSDEKYYTFTARFLANSKEQMDSFFSIMPLDLGMSSIKIKNLFVASCGKSTALKLMDWIYKDSKIHLKRKFLKYKKACDFLGRKPVTDFEGF